MISQIRLHEFRVKRLAIQDELENHSDPFSMLLPEQLLDPLLEQLKVVST